MIVDNITNDYKMTELLNELLAEIRKQRNFDVESFLSLKKNKILSYVKDSGITDIVIGVSGGVDSAVSLSMLNELSKESGVFNVRPIFMPAHQSVGVSGQMDAQKMAEKVCQKNNLDLLIMDLNETTNCLVNSFKGKVSEDINAWAIGQLVSYLRTPTLYFYATLINQEKGKLAVTATNINASEGQLIGYFGKAGDSMADLQLLSDLFKSEVYMLAKHYQVPEEIINRKPLPDMFDGKDDEVVFGFPYDFLEIYQSLLMDNSLMTIEEAKRSLKDDAESLEIFNVWEKNLNEIRKYNGHKYLVGSPSIHFDVIETNGLSWKYNNY